MKKITVFILVILMTLAIMPIHIVSAETNNPIIITKQFSVSAEKNSKTIDSEDYTVTVRGTIKNTSGEKINNIIIFLDVSTAFLGLKDTLAITISGELASNQQYVVNVSKDLAEKYAKVDKVYATVNGGAAFDLFSGTETDVPAFNFNFKIPSIWFSVALLAVFIGLFLIAILVNKND